MDTSVQINNQLNRMVNLVINQKQNQTGCRELWRYPLCILYGDAPDTICQMLEAELASRIGETHAFKLVRAKDRQGTDSLKEAVNELRSNMEAGIIKVKNQFYIPVIFMADQLDADEMSRFMQSLFRLMEKLGFGDVYQVCYYCILNYELMDGNSFKMQMHKLKGREKADFPAGIFTQNHLYASEYEKYLKTIQAVAMHIFLQTSQPDRGICILRDGGGNEVSFFTLGYWKFDILKQKIADYLIGCIKQQSEKMTEYGDYIELIKGYIDDIMEFNEEEWIKAYGLMPVNTRGLDEYFRLGNSRHPKMISFRELTEMLYGDVDSFLKFVRTNIGSGKEPCYLEAFWQKDIGNLYAVDRYLEKALADLKKYYIEERGKDKITMAGQNYDDMFCWKKHYSLVDVLGYLCSGFWSRDIKKIKLERKIEFIEELQKYIGLDEFKEKIEVLKSRNKEAASRIGSIRREAFMDEDEIIKMDDEERNPLEEQRILAWDQNVFEEEVFEKIQEQLSVIYQNIEKEVRENIAELIGNYIGKIGELKRNNQSALYYAAKMDIPRFTQGKEYVFIGEINSGRNNILERIQSIVRNVLPDAEVKERKWQTGICFEVFAIKEIEDLAEIYGIEENGDAYPC